MYAAAFPIFTVGHSNRSWPEFVHVLRSVPIEIVFDVRRYPQSRRNPHFSKEAVVPALAAAAIGYRHFPDLGGYRGVEQVTANGANDGWPPGFLPNYADYAQSNEFRRSLETLRSAKQPGAAIMCAEKHWEQWHRRIIADYLLMFGHEVVHVTDENIRDKGTMTTFGKAADNVVIHYPATSSQLRLRF